MMPLPKIRSNFSFSSELWVIAWSAFCAAAQIFLRPHPNFIRQINQKCCPLPKQISNHVGFSRLVRGSSINTSALFQNFWDLPNNNWIALHWWIAGIVLRLIISHVFCCWKAQMIVDLQKSYTTQPESHKVKDTKTYISLLQAILTHAQKDRQVLWKCLHIWHSLVGH